MQEVRALPTRSGIDDDAESVPACGVQTGCPTPTELRTERAGSDRLTRRESRPDGQTASVL